MSRPLIVTDCDEVLLHMVVPFRDWLDEEHDIAFDFAGGSALKLTHRHDNSPVDREKLWPLLDGFFATQMHRQPPITGALEAIGRLNEVADIVVLTNIGEKGHAGRVAQLGALGVYHPVVSNWGGKGPPLARLVEQYAPTVTLFIDDIAHNHESVAEHVPDAWRLHFVGEPQLASHISTSPHAHARIDNWARAESWLRERAVAGAPADALPV